MHHLEPFYGWQHLYRSEDDPRSPFFGREYSEFEYTNQIYNYAIHPQWDEFGSPTLLLKIIYVSYKHGTAVLELLGEWNDTLHNDIMHLKRNVIDNMQVAGIHKFILVGENVLNFHPSDDSYYEEWADDAAENNGWIAFVNFRQHVLNEFSDHGIDMYFLSGGELDELDWRTYRPAQLFLKVNDLFGKRLLS